jgi:hypothetical protein
MAYVPATVLQPRPRAGNVVSPAFKLAALQTSFQALLPALGEQSFGQSGHLLVLLRVIVGQKGWARSCADGHEMTSSISREPPA